MFLSLTARARLFRCKNVLLLPLFHRLQGNEESWNPENLFVESKIEEDFACKIWNPNLAGID